MPHNVRCRRERLAFSLVELLVVIGIIVVLIALLLPAISRARKQAYRVACMSNLRQVGQAVLAYAVAHKGSFPAAAYGDALYGEDWVHWQPGRDVRANGVMPYVGNNPEVLKCPMGVPERAPVIRTGGGGPPPVPPFPYSYSINGLFSGYSSTNTFNPRVSGEGFARLGGIVSPSEKVMLIEEDTTGINDGAFWPDSADRLTHRYSSVSLRHDKDCEFVGDPKVGGTYYRLLSDDRGNVVFADGHCDFYRRWNLQYPRYNSPNHRGP